MVKVLMERTIRGQNVGQIVRLLRQLRVLAMQQPDYISGETLHGVGDPNYYLVISNMLWGEVLAGPVNPPPRLFCRCCGPQQ